MGSIGDRSDGVNNPKYGWDIVEMSGGLPSLEDINAYKASADLDLLGGFFEAGDKRNLMAELSAAFRDAGGSSADAERARVWFEGISLEDVANVFGVVSWREVPDKLYELGKFDIIKALWELSANLPHLRDEIVRDFLDANFDETEHDISALPDAIFDKASVFLRNKFKSQKMVKLLSGGLASLILGGGIASTADYFAPERGLSNAEFVEMGAYKQELTDELILSMGADSRDSASVAGSAYASLSSEIVTVGDLKESLGATYAYTLKSEFGEDNASGFHSLYDKIATRYINGAEVPAGTYVADIGWSIAVDTDRVTSRFGDGEVNPLLDAYEYASGVSTKHRLAMAYLLHGVYYDTTVVSRFDQGVVRPPDSVDYSLAHTAGGGIADEKDSENMRNLESYYQACNDSRVRLGSEIMDAVGYDYKDDSERVVIDGLLKDLFRVAKSIDDDAYAVSQNIGAGNRLNLEVVEKIVGGFDDYRSSVGAIISELSVFAAGVSEPGVLEVLGLRIIDDAVEPTGDVLEKAVEILPFGDEVRDSDLLAYYGR